MLKRQITIETRLKIDNDFVEYMRSYIALYSRVKREMWHEMTSKNHKDNFPTLASYKKYCRGHYGMLGRTVNSLIYDVQGTMHSYMELKKTELQNLNTKIMKKEKKIGKLKSELDSLLPYVSKNIKMDKTLPKFHSKKQSLYYQKNKLNKMKQRQSQLKYQIENKVYSLCFGSKKEYFKQYRLEENKFKSHDGWYNHFIKQRDKNIFYLGANNESYGNQMCQLRYDKASDTFTIRIRKENAFCSDDDKYAELTNIDFKYRKDELISILQSYENGNIEKIPLTYRIHRENNKWYLQVIFSVNFDDTEYRTTNKHGTIGLDYNDGFIEMTETDESGNPVRQTKYTLQYHGVGDKAKTEIQQTISKIVQYAKQHCKDISIENLDFKRTKSMQEKAKGKKGKNYNRMLHKFDYSRYKQTMQDIAFNHRVRVILVNPKNTSKIGKQKYADIRKMTIHQAASLVIARKAQGFNDKLVA